MPSASAQKLVRKLHQRKHRWQERKFIAEGPKVVQDLLAEGLEPLFLWSTEEFPGAELAPEKELAKLSGYSTFNQILAVFDFPEIEAKTDSRILVLDRINDPGNLGTLLRTADWFGFSKVICTKGTADIYNPKAVQSTMGSLARVDISYSDEEAIWMKYQNRHQILRADMEGSDFHEFSNSPKDLVLVMGSESHGPSDFWKQKAQAVSIPKNGNTKIDSLNVAVAGGILMQALSPAAL